MTAPKFTKQQFEFVADFCTSMHHPSDMLSNVVCNKSATRKSVMDRATRSMGGSSS